MDLKKEFSAKPYALAGGYALLAFLSLAGAFILRFDFNFVEICKFLSPKTFVLIIAAKLFFLAIFGQFNILFKFFHKTDLANQFWAFTASAAFLLASSQILIKFGWVIPRGVILIDYFLSIILFAAIRMFFHGKRERSQSKIFHGNIKKRVAIIGAGDVGASLAENLFSHKSMGIIPVVFLDDDPQKAGCTISGIKILPLKTDLKKVVQKLSIDQAIIAISRLPQSRIDEITSEFSKLGIETNIVPSYQDLAAGYAKVSNLRKVSIEDVLGRKQIPLDTEELEKLIRGKRILVTGAGGSIGNELCRQIAMRKPSMLILLDQCEVQLFNVRENICAGNFGVDAKPVICNVADAERIRQIISEYKPQIVFHAAAHKHVPIMEYQAGEALKNNLLGTWHTAVASSENGVEKFVLISTDKAVNPTSVMGASKRLAEILIQSFQTNPKNKTRFMAVRFGNVLGSSGSVIPIFKRQIEAGGPITLTHPDAMRYFISIPEAVGLVLQCGSQALGGEIFVLDMGEQIKIIDLAKRMIKLSGFEPDVDIKIKTIGLRCGEKLQEEVQNKAEHLKKTKNPRILAFVSTPVAFEKSLEIVEETKRAILEKNNRELKEFIKKYVPEYEPQQ